LFKYTYNPLNRLIEANDNHYSYDALGNRVASLKNGIETTHQFNTRNQLIKTTEGDIETNYSYDNRGNLVSVLENGQQKASYTFDATNRMVNAVTQLNTASYSYNGFGNRVKKLEDMHETRFINDMTLLYNNLLDMNGQSFVWGNNLISAKGEDELYYLQDHLNSPVRLFGKNQEAALGFDEFGMPLVDSSINQPFGFTGYQMDVNGLQYAQARYYSPSLGRFSAEDPIRDKFNWYGYCGGNPVNFIDPRGLQECAGDAGGSTTSSQSLQGPVTPQITQNIAGAKNHSVQQITNPSPPGRETTGNFLDLTQPFNTGISHGNGPVTADVFYFNRSAIWPPKVQNGLVVYAEAGVLAVQGDHGYINWGVDFLAAGAKAGGQIKPDNEFGGMLGLTGSVHLLQVHGGYTVPAIYLLPSALIFPPTLSLAMSSITDSIMNGAPLNWGTISVTGSVGIGAERYWGVKFDESGLDFNLRYGGKPTNWITQGLSIGWKPPCD